MTADLSGDAQFDIDKWSNHIIVGTDGREHVVIAQSREILRLDVIAGTVRQGPVGLRVHLDCTRLMLAKLVALDSLMRVMGIQDRSRCPPADPRLNRLIEALRVVDALADGASLSRIASELYGSDHRKVDWPGEGEYLKSRVRRRVALAKRLIQAGPGGILNYRI